MNRSILVRVVAGTTRILLLSACSSSEPPTAGASGVDEVIGGEATDEFPAVGRVSSGCTATLIHPRVLLTAAHCCRTPNSCAHVRIDGRAIPTERFINHPDFTVAPGGGIAPSFDVSLLVLTEAVTNIAPRKLAKLPPAVDRPIRFVGFGCTALGGGGGGTKRTGTNTIAFFGTNASGEDAVRFRDVFGWRSAAIDGGTPNDDANICPGDSGGPTFWTEYGELVVAGVHSLVGPRTGYSCHVPPRADWIRARVAEIDPASVL